MMNTTFIKISLIIFVFLALLISLFPPFEFGNEKLRTLHERESYSDIANKLPVKRYDFIFNDNKKDISLDSNYIRKYFNNKESLEYYKKLWSDSKFEFSRSVDSFFTPKGFIYPLFLNERYPTGVRKINYRLNYKDFGLDNRQISEFSSNDEIMEWKHKEGYDDLIKEAINYIYVRKEYEKEPDNWWWNLFYHFDSAGKYDAYNISKPVYYLLDRNLIWSELVVEYILAILISVISGYLIHKFVPEKLRLKFNQVQ